MVVRDFQIAAGDGELGAGCRTNQSDTDKDRQELGEMFHFFGSFNISANCLFSDVIIPGGESLLSPIGYSHYMKLYNQLQVKKIMSNYKPLEKRKISESTNKCNQKNISLHYKGL